MNTHPPSGGCHCCVPNCYIHCFQHMLRSLQTRDWGGPPNNDNGLYIANIHSSETFQNEIIHVNKNLRVKYNKTNG